MTGSISFLCLHDSFLPLPSPFLLLFLQDFERNGLGTNCSDPDNQPDLQNNVRGERYGTGSRCVEQGQQWRRISGSTTYSSIRYGGGCYQVGVAVNVCVVDGLSVTSVLQYECSEDGVTIFVMEVAFKCNCEGEEVMNVHYRLCIFDQCKLLPFPTTAHGGHCY